MHFVYPLIFQNDPSDGIGTLPHFNALQVAEVSTGQSLHLSG
jgi:hypothetical protein